MHEVSPVERDAMASYNRLPFQGRAHRETHPRRLAARARLHGLPAPPTRACRVLELGCASGDNLIAMAVTMPDATFLGIDISPRQIREGRDTIAALGLHNISLEALGILEVPADLGTFDYIIAHGVYSWVPQPVRDKILEVFATNLSRDGIGYVCYNTYPGWHFREPIRHFLRTHVPLDQPEPNAARQARDLLDRLGQASIPDSLFGPAVAREVALFRDLPDAYLYHELLESDNQPFYFTSFLDDLRSAGLAYVTDTESFTALLDNLDDDIADWICANAGDRADVEQSLDYLYGRTIRHSLLTRRGAAILDRPSGDAVAGLAMAGDPTVHPESPSFDPGVTARFSSSNGKTLGVRDPVSKAGLLELRAAWPACLSFPDLLERTRARLGAHAGRGSRTGQHDQDVDILASTILAGHATGVLDLLDTRAAVADRIDRAPLASPLARHQVSTGRPFITNLYHEELALTEMERNLLLLMDGTRTCQELLASQVPDLLARSLLDNRVPPRAPARARPGNGGAFEESFDMALEHIRRAALLVPKSRHGGRLA